MYSMSVMALFSLAVVVVAFGAVMLAVSTRV
jgi:hypothetical protein